MAKYARSVSVGIAGRDHAVKSHLVPSSLTNGTGEKGDW